MSVRKGMILEADDPKHHLLLSVYIHPTVQGYQGRAALRSGSTTLFFGPTIAIGEVRFAVLKILDQLKFQHLVPFLTVTGSGPSDVLDALFDQLSRAVSRWQIRAK